MKVPIEKIKFIKELYPRFELDNYTVNQYRQSIDKLPPILISKNYVLIDGYHRLIAHKLEELKDIEVEFFDAEGEQEILIEAIKRNSIHGKQLSIDEKRKLTPKLWEKGLKNIAQLALIFSVSERTIRGWTQDVRDKEDNERDIEIWELYLQCWSYREIADKLEIAEKTVGNVLCKNGKFSKITQPDNLQFYNVWSVGKLSPDQLKYAGQTPLDIIENIVYYYTDPPQTEPSLKLAKVIDPMAGSGIVRDACRKLFRRYMLFDLEPLRQDIPIEKNDILRGLPEKARGGDLVYFDPPYYNLMNEYPDNEFTESYESFLRAMKTSLENIKEILSSEGKVALILKPMNEKMMEGTWLDMTFDCVIIAQKLGYKLIKRICAPLSTQQFTQNDVPRAKERKIMLNTLRDIVILERGNK